MAITMEQLMEVRDRLQSLQLVHDTSAIKATIKPLYQWTPRMRDLAASKIAVLMSQLAKDGDLSVKVHAETLLSKWKQCAAAEGISCPGNGASMQPVNGTASHLTNSLQALKAHRSHPYNSQKHHSHHHHHNHSNNLEHHEHSEHSFPDVHLYDDHARNVMVQRLAGILSLSAHGPQKLQPLDVAKEIELELHAMLEGGHDMEQKLIKYNQLRTNLLSNPELRVKVLLGEIPAVKLPHMKAWELGKLEARHEAHLKAQLAVITEEQEPIIDALGPPDTSRQ